ncbi:hypothetical protein RI129_009371 [Pyrocoelia pectoralis]|uniref:Uncharacterized protein n=1 Tax=Pyrocoelia pectoralis TaxID=417401 RepID=A0AAN7V6P4_9COLE
MVKLLQTVSLIFTILRIIILNLIKQKCIKETEIDPIIVDNAVENNFIDDPKLKFFFKCVMIAQKLLDENGNVHLEKYRKACEYEGRDCGYVDKCQQIRGETIEDTALRLYLSLNVWLSMYTLIVLN